MLSCVEYETSFKTSRADKNRFVLNTLYIGVVWDRRYPDVTDLLKSCKNTSAIFYNMVYAQDKHIVLFKQKHTY